MKDPVYWMRYPAITYPQEIMNAMGRERFFSSGKQYELICFLNDKTSPCILITSGSGGHSFVFAELAYLIYKKGLNVFIMPRHGGYTITELMVRHADTC